jgi:starch phosphorylase
LPENADRDRLLTQSLYGGDQYHRLCQEVILGVGGVRMLRALGHNYLTRFHMNEGHASLLTLELLGLEAQKAGRSSVTRDDIEAVREQCIFTTHTPVPAGHDSFPARLVTRVLGCREDFIDMTDEVCAQVVNRVLGGNGEITTMPELLRSESPLNLTRLALNLSHYVNGVAKRHGEVSRQMFTGYAIDAITNGVHAASWVAEPFQQLYDNYLPGWRENSASLRYGLSIPAQELWQAHMQAKKELLRFANHETNAGLNVDVLTLGFARRSTPYKRADLFFHDIERLKRLAAEVGALQVVYAGKAHPHDQGGKELINHIFYLKEELKKDVRVVYLENYDMALGKLITGGVDIWLNTPQPPLEASGTSGMKAALNGVPSLSILDGWWIEGCIEGVTGWAIGGRNHTIGSGCDNAKDAASLYDKLEQTVLPLFYANRDGFIEVMRNAITLNGSFFTTHRMMQEYVLKAYFS